jgi:long-subunit fatty acid transport protein
MAHDAPIRPVVLLWLALLALPAAVGAQAGLNTVQFNFSNPGARSMGFGGAFVALADDATAAFANPAGLVQIIEPEVSVEGRHWSYSTPYTVGGRLDGAPSGYGLDTVAGLRLGESGQDVASLAFLSFVYPRSRGSLAFYRHVLSRFEFAGETQGLFANPFPPDTGFRRENDRRLATEYDIVGYGLSGAWRISDRLSVGLGAVYFEAALAGSEEKFSFDGPERFFEANSYLPRRNTKNNFFELDDTDWGLTVGLLWSPSSSWRVGAAFREGPETDDFDVRVVSGGADPTIPAGVTLERITSPLAFPDTYGVGLAYRAPGDRLTLSLEWDRVEYSTILESLSFPHQAVVDDADELHAGAELVLLERRPVIALRAGAWLDPDHRLRTDEAGDSSDRAFFRRGADELHWAVGGGLVFRRFQVDLAVDLSNLVDTVSISTIYGL